MTRLRFIVDVDVERPLSGYLLNDQLRQAITKALSSKRLNAGKIGVYVNALSPVDRAALDLSAAILQCAGDTADEAASGAVDRHEDRYNHGLID